MTTPRLTGGSAYTAAIEVIDAEIGRLMDLIDQLAQADIQNGARQRLKATITASLLKQQRALNELKKIGQEAKQDRRTSND